MHERQRERMSIPNPIVVQENYTQSYNNNTKAQDSYKNTITSQNSSSFGNNNFNTNFNQ